MGGDLIKPDQNGIISLLHGAGGIDMPRPFEREIFLFDTHVAGTTHVEGILELEPHIREGDKLSFFREPENPYDELAIVVKNEHGVKLGYVPRDDNPVFSRLMDAGKLLFGRVSGKELCGNWLKIEMKIFLLD